MLKWLKSLSPSRAAPWCQRQTDLFSTDYLSHLAGELLQSPYLAANVLNQRFARTAGFSLVFRATHVSAVLASFPILAPFLARVVCPPFNLYYLNALVLPQAAEVEKHIDHSIRGYNNRLPWPRQVSVLYVAVPTMQGGELHLLDLNDQLWMKIIPETGLMICFRGDVKHLITPVTQTLSGARLSLVCEQYCLSAAELEHVPTFTLKSTIGFDAFLGVELTDNP
jgi:hypothetical protein